MAAKKEIITEPENFEVYEEEEVKASKPKTAPVIEPELIDPWDEMVAVHLPRGDRSAGTHQFVSLNNRAYQVARGREVMVPRPIAARLRIVMQAEEEEYQYLKSIDGKEAQID